MNILEAEAKIANILKELEKGEQVIVTEVEINQIDITTYGDEDRLRYLRQVRIVTSPCPGVGWS